MIRIISIQRSSRWKLALKDICIYIASIRSRIYSNVKDVHPIYSMSNSVETCIERYLHLSHIYSEVKDIHPIYATFKSVETCVEKYLDLSHIYSEVKDMHPIYLTFKLKETCVERYLHLSRIYSEVKDVHPIYSMFMSVKTCVERYLHLSRIYSKIFRVSLLFIAFMGNHPRRSIFRRATTTLKTSIALTCSLSDFFSDQNDPIFLCFSTNNNQHTRNNPTWQASRSGELQEPAKTPVHISVNNQQSADDLQKPPVTPTQTPPKTTS
ncbi:hypothetical protein H5410_031833 [Solanum commersonii]|uniref:Uncharacterized protein n=1 Tax=Solanum commersonii TaxID=4109 RepID=A0A9J5YL43_SOLCO|nr:hypothetical protein H5410_031833 [Solanum commersonii]